MTHWPWLVIATWSTSLATLSVATWTFFMQRRLKKVENSRSEAFEKKITDLLGLANMMITNTDLADMPDARKNLADKYEQMVNKARSGQYYMDSENQVLLLEVSRRLKLA